MRSSVRLGIVCGILAGAGGLALWLWMHPLVRTAEEFLALAAEARFEEAHRLMAKGPGRQGELVERLSHPLMDLRSLKSVSWAWGSRGIRSGAGRLEGTLIAHDGSRRAIFFRFRREEGEWRITRFDSPPGWKAISSVYRNEEHRYSIVLPDGWDITLRPSLSLDADANPNDRGPDPFIESVGVLGEELPAGMTLEKYGASYERTWRKELEGLRRIDVDEIHVNGLAGRRYLIQHRAFGMDAVSEAYLFVKGNRGYAILCSAPSHTFLTYQPLFEAVVRSLRVG